MFVSQHLVTTARRVASYRDICEAFSWLEEKANTGVVQPNVCNLTGDVDLSKDVATALIQPERGEPNLIKHWHTQSSNSALFGDVAFVKGTASKAWDASIGASYKDIGMRRDSHDFFWMTLKLPLVQASASSGAPQPAAAEIPPTSAADLSEDHTTDEGKAADDKEITEEGTDRRVWKREHKEQQEYNPDMPDFLDNGSVTDQFEAPWPNQSA